VSWPGLRRARDSAPHKLPGFVRYARVTSPSRAVNSFADRSISPAASIFGRRAQVGRGRDGLWAGSAALDHAGIRIGCPVARDQAVILVVDSARSAGARGVSRGVPCHNSMRRWRTFSPGAFLEQHGAVDDFGGRRAEVSMAAERASRGAARTTRGAIPPGSIPQSSTAPPQPPAQRQPLRAMPAGGPKTPLRAGSSPAKPGSAVGLGYARRVEKIGESTMDMSARTRARYRTAARAFQPRSGALDEHASPTRELPSRCARTERSLSASWVLPSPAAQRSAASAAWQCAGDEGAHGVGAMPRILPISGILRDTIQQGLLHRAGEVGDAQQAEPSSTKAAAHQALAEGVHVQGSCRRWFPGGGGPRGRCAGAHGDVQPRVLDRRPFANCL